MFYFDCRPARMGAAVRAVHAFIARHALDSLAIAFPKAGQGRTGPVLRVFAPDAQTLECLAAWEGLRDCQNDGVQAVPDSVSGWAVWRRARTPEKSGGGFADRTGRRFIRRRLALGDAEAEARAKADARRQNLLSRRQDKTGCYIAMQSSGGQAFGLFVECEAAPSPKSGPFSGYGLSMDGATVPLFNT